jgi:hypothetical protein
MSMHRLTKRITALGLCTCLVCGAIGPTVALGCEGGSEESSLEWLEEGARINAARNVEGEAENRELTFRDTARRIAAVCESSLSGRVNSRGTGEMLLLGACRAREGLETLESVTTTGPWSTLLETVGGVKKDEIMGTPKFTIRGRATGGAAVDDTCEKARVFPGIRDIIGGVKIEFETAERLECSEGGRGAGTIVGNLSVGLENRRGLSVS